MYLRSWNGPARNIERVHILTLIPVRMANENDPFEYYARGEKISIGETPYVSPEQYENLSSVDVYEEIIKVLPDYKFNAYLGGTAYPSSLKWVVGNHVGSRERSYGKCWSQDYGDPPECAPPLHGALISLTQSRN